MDNVIRPLTEDEKKEITPLGSTSLLDLFLKELAKKVTEYQKAYKPYDSYGAHIDFEDRVKTQMNAISSAVDKSTVTKFDFGDLDQYGKKDLFDFIEKHEHQQTRLVAGIKQEVIIGYRYKFKCKTRGNMLSIFVPNEKEKEFQKWLNDTYLKPKVDVKSDVKSEVKLETKTTK